MTASVPSCEICGGRVTDWELAPRQVLGRCEACGHLRRDLARCPAGHRDGAWGGEADMDGVRLSLTYRRLRRSLRAGSAPGPGLAGLRVFEAGFGSGALLRRFLDDGASVAGADPGALGTPVDPVVAATGGLVAGPAEESTDHLGTYDLVVGVHVVEHVPDPWGFARTCHDLARAAGGTVVLVTPAGDSRSLSRSGASWWMLEDPTHVRFFSAASLTMLMERSGLVVRSVTRPLEESLSVEAASFVRRRRGTGDGPPGGVLADVSTRVLAACSLPAVVPLRLLRPARRPAIQVIATRP